MALEGIKGYADKITKPLTDFWNNADKKRRTQLIVVIGIILVVVITSLILLGNETYEVLYPDLSAKEAGEIITRLDALKIAYKTKDDGTILVPQSVVSKTKMTLAYEGLPKSSSPYDDYKDYTSSFGTTESDKQRMWTIALEQNLEDTISTIEQVNGANVHLTIPDTPSAVIKSNIQEPSVAVVLDLNSQLTDRQVSAIQDLILKSVTSLKAENVSIIDRNMNQLNNTSESAVSGTQLEMQQRVQNTLRSQILAMLEPVFGSGAITASVAVTLDFDKKQTESEIYTPVVGDKGIEVSKETANSRSTGTSNGSNPGQDANGDTIEYTINDSSSSSNTAESSQIVNYNVNKTVENIIKSSADIKDLSVSVILDSNKVSLTNYNTITDLISNGIGISDYNRITVSALPFTAQSQMDELMNSTRSALWTRSILKNVTSYGGIILVLLILLYIAYKTLHNMKSTPAAQTNDLAMANGIAINSAIDHPSDSSQPAAKRRSDVRIETSQFTPSDPALEDVFDESNPSEYHKAQIQKFITSNPITATQILRTWLNESNGPFN